ncbi:hypothetical protein Tco_1036793, partial [Tanacetum coccineum]
TSSITKSSSPIDNSKQQDTPPRTNNQSSTEPTTPTTYVNVDEENNDNQAADTQFQHDEFINPFYTLVREIAESSSRNIDNSNMHTFYQPHDSKYRGTNDHPLEQVRGNPSKPVQTRRQLVTDPEMCVFALTVSTDELKNIKEAMADSAWIEVMQEELHQFDRLQVWELIDKPFGKTVIKLKWLWKNKKDKDQTAKYALEILKKYGMDKGESIGTPMATKPKLDADLSGKLYSKDYGFELTAFSDADHARCLDTRKSTSRGIQFIGDKLVSWISKKQDNTAMSLATAEYVALSASCAQVENGIIELYFVRTEYQLADMFNKALPEDRFQYLVRQIGMRCLTPAELEVLANESA